MSILLAFCLTLQIIPSPAVTYALEEQTDVTVQEDGETKQEVSVSELSTTALEEPTAVTSTPVVEETATPETGGDGPGVVASTPVADKVNSTGDNAGDAKAVTAALVEGETKVESEEAKQKSDSTKVERKSDSTKVEQESEEQKPEEKKSEAENTEEKKDEQQVEEEKKPAASKSASAGSITATVEVGEGVFAEGWTLSASLGSTDGAQSALGQADVKVIAAVELSAYDKDGKVIGLPAGATVKVTLSGANAASDDVTVYRISGGSALAVSATVANANTQKFVTDTLAPAFAITEKVPEEPEEELSYPSASLSDSANGVTVDAEAPEGALPEGAKLVLAPVATDDVREAVAGAVDGDVVEIAAVDISFVDADNNPVGPWAPVSVTLSGLGAEEEQKLYALHVKDGASVVASADAAASLTFESADFSTYVLATAETVVETPKRLTATKAAEAETWTVTFYNRDSEVHTTVDVTKGEAIGNQLPAAIAREDYNAYWGTGTGDGGLFHVSASVPSRAS